MSVYASNLSEIIIYLIFFFYSAPLRPGGNGKTVGDKNGCDRKEDERERKGKDGSREYGKPRERNLDTIKELEKNGEEQNQPLDPKLEARKRKFENNYVIEAVNKKIRLKSEEDADKMKTDGPLPQIDQQHQDTSKEPTSNHEDAPFSRLDDSRLDRDKPRCEKTRSDIRLEGLRSDRTNALYLKEKDRDSTSKSKSTKRKKIVLEEGTYYLFTSLLLV